MSPILTKTVQLQKIHKESANFETKYLPNETKNFQKLYLFYSVLFLFFISFQKSVTNWFFKVHFFPKTVWFLLYFSLQFLSSLPLFCISSVFPPVFLTSSKKAQSFMLNAFIIDVFYNYFLLNVFSKRFLPASCPLLTSFSFPLGGFRFSVARWINTNESTYQLTN